MSFLRQWPTKKVGPALALSMGRAVLQPFAAWGDSAASRLKIEWSADGAPVPTLRLPPNRAVTVSFQDSDGVPWPVSEPKVAITESLSYGRGAQHPHAVFMEIEEDKATGNLVALLDGLPTPVHLQILCSSEASATDLLVRVAAPQAGVRLQMPEYPILGEESDQAARAAMAAARQGAYEGAHFALMAREGGFDTESIEGIARDLGPAGVRVSPGAVDADRLAGMIAEPGLLVQSLLQSPTGHLTNLSAEGR